MVFDQEAFDDLVISLDVIKMPREGLVLKSGRRSHWYANWRDVNDVFVMEQLANFVVEYCVSEGLLPDCFYGVPEGATQLATLTQFIWAKNSGAYTRGSHALPMGRGKPKEHGDPSNRYFVRSPRGRVLLLEDVTTTAGSAMAAVDSLASLEDVTSVIGVVALLNRHQLTEGRTVKDLFNQQGMFYGALSDGPSLLPKAYQRMQPGEDVGRLIENEVRGYCGVEIKLVD